ncbi:MAG: glycosyltransferase family 4 protein [Acidimicrobiales bacterium]
MAETRAINARRVTVLTKFLPFPSNNGGKQRAAASLEALSSEFSVHVVAFREDDLDTRALEDLGVTFDSVPWPTGLRDKLVGLVRTRSLSSARFYSRDLARRLDESIEKSDATIIEYVQLAPMLPRTLGPLVLASHNVESALVDSLADTKPLPSRLILKAEAWRLRRTERLLIKRCGLVTVIAESDAKRLPAQPNHTVTCPNGWPRKDALPPSSMKSAVFVATLGWAPNVDACRFLAREIWPKVVQQCPDARLTLVGRDPTPEILEMADDTIRVCANVPEIEPFLAQARLSLAPLRAGGGSRLKILESLAVARPVVATKIGAEGLEELWGQGIVVADTSDEFASETVRLLNDAEEANEIGLRGRTVIRQRFSWDHALAPLREWLDERVP